MKNKKLVMSGIVILTICILSAGIILAEENTVEKTVTETAKENTTEKTVTETAKEDKSSVYNKMLNSIDNFETIQGEFKLKSSNESSVLSVQYSADMSAGYAMETVQGGNVNIQTITDESQTILYNHTEKGYFEFQMGDDDDDPVSAMSAEERNQERDGETVWYYRKDPTGFTYAKEQIFPQERIFGYLNDFESWNISQQEEINNRSCWKLDGVLTGQYSEKLHVTSFSFWVDKETGCLLKYEGHNQNDELTEYLTTEDIIFNQPIATTYENDLEVEGYRDLLSESMEIWENSIAE